MRCVRCDGLMVSEKVDDLGSLKLNGYEDTGWRCINCGAIVDPVIAANRRLTSQTTVSSEALTAA
ncbi:MAG TPA: hypothetical protein VLA67_05910 [Nitrospiraceae bacterium]|nr:hypothetical protein [Nitrospiraceae bacterium]